ncbi:MAG: addiction module antidote protein [Enterobacteriaceae bacterium]
MREIIKSGTFDLWLKSLRDIQAKASQRDCQSVEKSMKQRNEEFSRYDTADYLTNEAEIMAYLEAAIEDGDPALIAAALGDIAKARGITKLAKEVGMSREGLYKALSGTGNPTFATMAKVAKALGFRFTLQSAS